MVNDERRGKERIRGIEDMARVASFLNHIQPLLIAAVIYFILHIIANFPEIRFDLLGNEVEFYLIPLTIQLIIRFALTVLNFIIVLAAVLAAHIWIIVNVIRFARFLPSVVTKLIEFLDNL